MDTLRELTEGQMELEKNDQMIKAECFPSIPREEIGKRSSYRIPLDRVIGFGGAFSVAGAEIVRAAKNGENAKGLYRCIFPDGVTGRLATFKEESQYNLGTIINESGIAGQARWAPVNARSFAMPFNPVSMATAVAIMNIDKKMEEIQQTTQQILCFLQQDKESDLEASVNSLADILDHFRYNSENDLWKVSQLTVATTIKGKAEKSIIFYRRQIQQVLKDNGFLHVNQQVNNVVKNVRHNFKYYQLGVYLYAYASFLEVILNGNYRKDFLDRIYEKLEEYSQQYRFDYTRIYDQLESFAKTSVETIALNEIGKASKGIGAAIARIPVVNKGPVDDALIAAGNTVKKLSRKNSDSAMRKYRDNRDSGIQLFMENIETINRIGNKPVEILFDQEEAYICLST